MFRHRLMFLDFDARARLDLMRDMDELAAASVVVGGEAELPLVSLVRPSLLIVRSDCPEPSLRQILLEVAEHAPRCSVVLEKRAPGTSGDARRIISGCGFRLLDTVEGTVDGAMLRTLMDVHVPSEWHVPYGRLLDALAAADLLGDLLELRAEPRLSLTTGARGGEALVPHVVGAPAPVSDMMTVAAQRDLAPGGLRALLGAAFDRCAALRRDDPQARVAIILDASLLCRARSYSLISQLAGRRGMPIDAVTVVVRADSPLFFELETRATLAGLRAAGLRIGLYHDQPTIRAAELVDDFAFAEVMLDAAVLPANRAACVTKDGEAHWIDALVADCKFAGVAVAARGTLAAPAIRMLIGAGLDEIYCARPLAAGAADLIVRSMRGRPETPNVPGAVLRSTIMVSDRVGALERRA